MPFRTPIESLTADLYRQAVGRPLFSEAFMRPFQLAVVFSILNCPVQSPVAKGEDEERNPAALKIHWTEDVKRAVTAHYRLRRPIVVYVTAGFCGYCHKMEQETWSDPFVRQHVNEYYVALKLTVEKQQELIERLRIRRFPSTIVFGADGKYRNIVEGFVNHRDLLKVLNAHHSTASRSPR